MCIRNQGFVCMSEKDICCFCGEELFRLEPTDSMGLCLGCGAIIAKTIWMSKEQAKQQWPE